MASQAQVSNQFEPKHHSTPIESSSNRSNDRADSQSQRELATPQSGSASPTDIKFEIDHHLDDDSDVICLGEDSIEVIDLASDYDPSTQELFVQCNDITHTENLIPVQTQSSQVVSKEYT